MKFSYVSLELRMSSVDCHVDLVPALIVPYRHDLVSHSDKIVFTIFIREFKTAQPNCWRVCVLIITPRRLDYYLVTASTLIVMHVYSDFVVQVQGTVLDLSPFCLNTKLRDPISQSYRNCQLFELMIVS